jgi:hypothetical protein
MKALKVKIFTDFTRNINASNQVRINQWLAEHPDIEILHILQTESMCVTGEEKIDRNLSISIFYR